MLAFIIVLGALDVFAATSAVFYQSPFSEYLAAGRRCAEQHECPGANAAIESLHHGTSWIRLLAYSVRSGTDQTQVQSVVLGLLILSVPTISVFVGRYLGLQAAALALGLYLPAVLTGSDYSTLNYPNLLPLPLAVFYLGIALFIERWRPVFAVVAAIALAAAVSIELGCIPMLPILVLLAAMAAPRPLPAIAVASVAFAIPYCLASMGPALELVRQLFTPPVVVGVTITAGAAALVLRMGPRVLLPDSASAPERVRAVMTVALIYATTAVCLAALFITRKWPQPRYFMPAIIPLMYLVAERMGALRTRGTVGLVALESLSLFLLAFAPQGIDFLRFPVMVVVILFALEMTVRRIVWNESRPASLWPAVILCGCVLTAALGRITVDFKRGPAQAITLAEAERLVSKLYAAGYTYPELVSSLQGPATDDLMSILVQRDPNLFAVRQQFVVNTSFSILVLKVPNAAIARTRGVIAAVPVGDSRSAIVVHGERSYLDWARARRCRWRDAHPTVYECMTPRTDQPLPQNWPYVEFGHPVSIAEATPPVRFGDYWGVSYQVPVHTPGHAGPHVVRAANKWPAALTITHVQGVEFEGTLPATEIQFPDTREATGVVEFELAAPFPTDLPWVWIPNVIEVTQENAHLLEAFRGTR